MVASLITYLMLPVAQAPGCARAHRPARPCRSTVWAAGCRPARPPTLWVSKPSSSVSSWFRVCSRSSLPTLRSRLSRPAAGAAGGARAGGKGGGGGVGGVDCRLRVRVRVRVQRWGRGRGRHAPLCKPDLQWERGAQHRALPTSQNKSQRKRERLGKAPSARPPFATAPASPRQANKLAGAEARSTNLLSEPRAPAHLCPPPSASLQSSALMLLWDWAPMCELFQIRGGCFSGWHATAWMPTIASECN